MLRSPDSPACSERPERSQELWKPRKALPSLFFPVRFSDEMRAEIFSVN